MILRVLSFILLVIVLLLLIFTLPVVGSPVWYWLVYGAIFLRVIYVMVWSMLPKNEGYL